MKINAEEATIRLAEIIFSELGFITGIKFK